MRIAPVVAALAVSSPAWAAEVSVTFVQAADAAGANPQLAQARRAQEHLEGASRSAPRLDANPVVSLALGPRVSPSFARRVEGQVGVSQAVNLAGAAGLRRQALAAEARTAGASARQLRMTLRLAAARAWLDLWAAQRLLAVARLDEEAARRAQRAVEALVSAGERTRPEALVAQRQAAEAAARVLGAEGAMIEAQGQLASELGLGADDHPVAAGEPADVVAPGAAEQRAALAGVDALPAAQSRRLVAAEERVRGAEERAGRGTWLSAGLEARSDIDGVAVLGSVTMPLPLQGLGLREEASRRALALRAEGEAADAVRRGRRELVLAFHEVEHTEQVARALDDRVLPAAEQALAALERAFAAGEVTLLERLDGQRALLDARSRSVAAARDRAWARVRAAVLVEATRRPAP